MYRNVVPLSRHRHAALRLTPARGYGFAATQHLVPVWGGELTKAAVCFPLGFVAQGGAYVLVAVLGLEAGRNLFVAQDGRWLGWYLPAALRRYPFLLGRPEGGGEPVVCIDEASDRLSESEGEPLFADGEPTPALTGIVDLLRSLQDNARPTEAASAALNAAGLIVPWTLPTQGSEGERHVRGLYRVDEKALGGLDDEAFLALRRAGALVLAYAQLFSQSRLPLLHQLAAAHAQVVTQQLSLDEMLDLGQGDVFKFD